MVSAKKMWSAQVRSDGLPHLLEMLLDVYTYSVLYVSNFNNIYVMP